jgi:hypothetical protein
MEYVEGGALILLGLLIIVFGGAGTPGGGSGAAVRFAPPAWFDSLLKWGIGILCIWFGASLLRGHSHFF